jgi:hypothetical protein
MRTEEAVFENGEKTVHTYNDAGMQVRTVDYDAAGNIRFDIQYDVDTFQRVVGWKVLDGNGNTVKRFEVDFDEQGLEIETRQYGSRDELERRERYLYDDDNERVEEQHFDAAGILRSRRVLTSTGDGNLTGYYDAQGNPLDGPAA